MHCACAAHTYTTTTLGARSSFRNRKWKSRFSTHIFFFEFSVCVGFRSLMNATRINIKTIFMFKCSMVIVKCSGSAVAVTAHCSVFSVHCVRIVKQTNVRVSHSTASNNEQSFDSLFFSLHFVRTDIIHSVCFVLCTFFARSVVCPFVVLCSAALSSDGRNERRVIADVNFFSRFAFVQSLVGSSTGQANYAISPVIGRLFIRFGRRAMCGCGHLSAWSMNIKQLHIRLANDFIWLVVLSFILKGERERENDAHGQRIWINNHNYLKLNAVLLGRR